MMGRWTQEDEDDYRLPEGIKRTGYDADTGRYYFTDSEGNIWEGPEGAEFGEMRRISGPTHDDDDDEELNLDVEAQSFPSRRDGYHALAVDPTNSRIPYSTPNWRLGAYSSLLPFFLIIGVLLLLAWRFFVSPVLSSPPSSESCSNNLKTYLVQPGDSCWAIATTHGYDLERLRELNPGLECERLMPGTTVCLPPGLDANSGAVV